LAKFADYVVKEKKGDLVSEKKKLCGREPKRRAVTTGKGLGGTGGNSKPLGRILRKALFY